MRLLYFGKHFLIKTVCTAVKNPQENALVERVYLVVYKIIVSEDLSNKLFDCINPRRKILTLLPLTIRGSCNLLKKNTSPIHNFCRNYIQSYSELQPQEFSDNST